MGGDKTGKVWSSQSLRCLATLGPCASYVTSGALNSKRNLFAASVDRSLVLFRVELDLRGKTPAGPEKHQTAARSAAEQSVENWSAEDVRQWVGALGVTMTEVLCDIDGAKLAQSSHQDLVKLGLTDENA